MKFHKWQLTWLQTLIIIILAIGIFFRFYNLDKKVYWIDEVHTSVRISGYKKTEFVETAPANRIINIEELQKFQRLSSERGWLDAINALAGNAEHAPLYYLIARFWEQWFGSSVAVTRGVAATLSLLAFPSIYWLCLELFASPLVGWMAMALIAVSPLHVLYAQEARQYSLWTAAILLSSAALLRAIRLQTVTSWGIYAATVAMGLYSHLLSVLVFIGHGIYIFASPTLKDGDTHTKTAQTGSIKPAFAGFVRIAPPFRVGDILSRLGSIKPAKTGSIKPAKTGFVRIALPFRVGDILARVSNAYILSSLAGFLTLIPWIILYFINASSVGTWVARNISFLALIQRWLLNLSAVFFDIQIGSSDRIFDVESGQDYLLFGSSNLLIYLMIPIVILVGYSIYFLCRQTPKQIWLFILTFGGVTAIAMTVPDIISGGQRSGIARYLIPCYLGIQLAVAYLLTAQITDSSAKHWQRQFWRVVAIALFTASIISCAVSGQAETWWNKYSCYYNDRVARIINQTPHPLVISSRERVSRLTSLSYKLDPKVQLLLINGTNIPEITDDFTEIFLFRPSGELSETFDRDFSYKIEPIYPKGHLWKLEK